jgi:hypothetical protein
MPHHAGSAVTGGLWGVLGFLDDLIDAPDELKASTPILPPDDRTQRRPSGFGQVQNE